jgi:hypothetical protein
MRTPPSSPHQIEGRLRVLYPWHQFRKLLCLPCVAAVMTHTDRARHHHLPHAGLYTLAIVQ